MRPVALEAAAHAVSNGELVVLPTDTVVRHRRGCVRQRCCERVAGRQGPGPRYAGSGSCRLVGARWRASSAASRSAPAQLIEAFWPGGLTLVVEHAPSLGGTPGDARGTVAVRMPLHPVALELLERTGPMAVSSANRTGKPAAILDRCSRRARSSGDECLDLSRWGTGQRSESRQASSMSPAPDPGVAARRCRVIRSVARDRA